jgi:hypothetical protein
MCATAKALLGEALDRRGEVNRDPGVSPLSKGLIDEPSDGFMGEDIDSIPCRRQADRTVRLFAVLGSVSGRNGDSS